MKKQELFEYLKKEESKTITGWDFSYLDGRWDDEELPWDYKAIVLQYLNPNYKLLDMGTGGGEFLMSLNHPYNNTSVTELINLNDLSTTNLSIGQVLYLP